MLRDVHKLKVLRVPGPEGPFPLVFVHGFPLDGRMWAEQAPLARTRTLLVPDLPGFGGSPPLPAPFTFEDLAEALESALAEAGTGPVALCGLSMGCTLSVAFAARHPERLRALILVGGRAAGETPEGRRARSAYAEQVRSEGTAGLVEDYLGRLVSEGSRAARPDLEGTLRNILSSQSPETVAHTLEAMRDRPDRTGSLGAISCPTLLLVGELDPFVAPSEMRAMADSIPEARLVVIPHVGHMPCLEAPGIFNRLIAAFLVGVERRLEEDP